jgi:DnaJ-class molecular chaperone
MKTLTATKIAASATTIAACTAASATPSSHKALSRVGLGWTTTTTATASLANLAISIPRGGDKAPKDDDNDYDKKSKNKEHDKKKSKPRSKKKRPRHSKSKPEAETSFPSNPIVEGILQHDDYYDVLGVDKGADDIQIQKAYRRRAVQIHPDKTGGDRRAFDKVAEAYHVLSDSTKRQLYDQYGKQGVEHGGAPGGVGGGMGSYSDVFRMFQQQQQQQQRSRYRQNHTVRYQLQVTLEDLYKGKTQSVVVTSPTAGTESLQKRVDVHIPKGSISGQSILMSGEMDFHQGDTPGDLIFVLTQVPHSKFTRKGHDLAMELLISLEQAVCGVEQSITHLDGSEIGVRSAREDQDIPRVIQTGDVQVLKGYGMPKRNERDAVGDLYIQYRVQMPKNSKYSTLTPDQRKVLGKLLRKLEGIPPSEKKEEEHEKSMHYLDKASSSDFGRASGNVAVEDDEHDREDDGNFHPFASSFAQGRGMFFGGASPFGGRSPQDDEDGSDVQCQQM